ncbi:hypothetical protein Gpo141_00001960 [Globisporangium polare]
MEEFELNMMAFLDGYEALSEPAPPPAADSAAYAASNGATAVPLEPFQQPQQQPQQYRQFQRMLIDNKPPLPKQQQDDMNDLAVLRETEQLLDSLEVSAFLDATMTASPPQQTPGPVPPANEQYRHPSMDDADDHEDNGSTAGGGGGEKRGGKTRNLSRERLKNELTYLRQKVSELEEELRVLRPGSTLTGGSNAADLVALDRKKAILPVWQRIAERQLEGRSKSEAENARLKDMLEGQIKLAKGLEQMLRKRPSVALMNGDNAGVHGKKPRLELDDESIYAMLTDGIEPAYESMDAVFRENGLYDTCDESIRHAHVKTRKDSGVVGGDEYLYVELADVFVIPFDLQVSSNAAWRSVTLQYLKENHAIYQNVTQPEDTIAVKFQVSGCRKGTDARLDVKLVMRRYIEKERMVLVWRKMAKGENQLSGMYTDETGWCVLKKIPASASSPSTAATGPNAIGTVMQSCVHVVPKRSGAVIHENIPEIGMLTNVVVDAYEEDVIAINKAMENLLLEEALSLSAKRSAAKTAAATATVSGAETKPRVFCTPKSSSRKKT